MDREAVDFQLERIYFMRSFMADQGRLPKCNSPLSWGWHVFGGPNVHCVCLGILGISSFNMFELAFNAVGTWHI